MKIRASRFRPAWWLRGGNRQTIWPALLRPAPSVVRQRERFALSDGDFVDLDWQLEGEGPLVVMLHGLTGSSESRYVMGLQRTLHQRGWRSVAMSFRGCSGEPNLLPRSYHSGETGDLAALIALVQRRFPHTPKAAVGFSLGGNVLLKWLGETRTEGEVFAAVAVSVPFLLGDCAMFLERGFRRVYMRNFVQGLFQSLRCKEVWFRKQGKTREAAELEVYRRRVNPRVTLRHFDDVVTAPLHGFVDAADYYQRCSSRAFLPTIQTPTLILQSLDDPFMPRSILPDTSELSPQVVLELSEAGGHVGFLAGTGPGRPVYWLEQRIATYLEEQLAR